MKDELARRSHAVFMRAVELEACERTAYINAACGDDPLLRSQVARLLAALERSGTFLRTPALGAARATALRTQLAPPEVIGKYRIRRPIGAGGMATVYEALQDQPQRRVALKVLRFGLRHSSALERFRFETEVLARLHHPGIAQIYEAGAFDDGTGQSTPYFAMEYIASAATITEYANRRRLSIRDRLALFLQVCDAVQHGHQQGVIHRDLKPGNILVSDDREERAGDEREEKRTKADGLSKAPTLARPFALPKVIDFGVARAADPDQTRITLDSDRGGVVGTLHYMSPEQATEGGAIDIRTDVYSLGVILYELVSGRLPHDFSRVAVLEALRVIRDDLPLRPQQLNPALRGDIDAIVMKAIEKEPDRRYATVAAFAADIQRHLAGDVVEARPPTLFYRTTRFARRHRGLLAAVAAVLFAILAGSILSAKFAYETWRESLRRLAAEEKAIFERDAAQWQTYTASIAAALAAAQTNEMPAARMRLNLAPAEHRGWEWGFIANQVMGEIQTVAAHRGMIIGFCASPDRRRVASAGQDGAWRIWDAESGAALAGSDRLSGTPIHTIAFSPDGRKILTGSEDGRLLVWDANTSQLLHALGSHKRGIRGLHWADDGRIVSASSDGVALLWNSEYDSRACVLDDQPGGITGIAGAPDHSFVLTWNARGSVWQRNSPLEPPIREFRFDGELTSVAVSFDGAQIALGGTEGRLTLWDARSGEQIHDFSVPYIQTTMRSLAFSQDGEFLAAGQVDRTLALFSLPTRRRLVGRYGHEEAVSGMLFGPGNRWVLSASWDGTIRRWSVEENAGPGRVQQFSGHDDFVQDVAFSPVGGLIASASRDKTVRLWDVVSGACLGALRGHEAAVHAVAFSPFGDRIASGASDGTVYLWNACSGVPEPASWGQRGSVYSLAFSPDGRDLATAGGDGRVYVGDLASRRMRHVLAGHAAHVNQIAYSPDGRWLASASRDKSVRVWDAETGAARYELCGHESDVFSVAFSPDSRLLLSGSRDQTVRVWDMDSGACLRTLTAPGQFITRLAINRDGSRLIAASWYGELIIWDLPSLEMVTSYKAHLRTIRGLAFSPDGFQLATGSYDNSIRVYDAMPSSTREQQQAREQASRAAAQALLQQLERTLAGPNECLQAIAGNPSLDADTRLIAERLVLTQILSGGASRK